ncbi:MAG: DUF1549 domain-containing protein [Gemmataceae bacterium]|nr:DUF1549 domain-containing protein [Gemmataceae bacterium]
MRSLIAMGVGWLVYCPLAVAAPDFETQVIPVLTKSGCNSGACHGAAIGRGGFRLSLLGYDPDLDYETMLRDLQGRRVNLVKPEKSLLLRKPTRDLAHEGGHKLAAGGDGYKLVRDWIAAGAPRETRRTLQSVEITPTTKTLPAAGEKFALKVIARYKDGATEDVTPWAVFTPTDTAALRINAEGEVMSLRRGQSAVMVRFLGEVGSVSVTVPLADEPVKGGRPRTNYIDDHVNRALDQLRLPHSPCASEETLVRRLYIDLIGTLPEPREVDDFVNDKSTDKRAKLVERLMQRPEFADFWALKWGDLLRIDSKRLQPEGAMAFHQWVRDQVVRNTPLDRMAREMILTLGDGHAVGPVNFSRIPGDAGNHAEHVSQVFLGVRLQCANCHNHPLDRWTQDDYHGLAAVFSKLSRGRSIALQAKGEVIHPKTGKSAVPRIPGVEFLTGDGDPREKFTDWLTSAENPYFARAAVNRLWRELMGRGLVEPIDDHRSTNPATHPELLQALAKDFVEHRFDVRHTIRTIVASEAYQRSSLAAGANKSDDRFYSRALLRPLPPAVMVDAVAKVTGVAEKLGNRPTGERAIALMDARVESTPLDLLGRCVRDNSCTPSLVGAGSLPLALHKINGPWLHDKIVSAQGKLHQSLANRKTDEEIVASFYETALGRKPSAKERAHWKTKLAADTPEERIGKFEDFLWALLNSTEFACNH